MHLDILVVVSNLTLSDKIANYIFLNNLKLIKYIQDLYFNNQTFSLIYSIA